MCKLCFFGVSSGVSSEFLSVFVPMLLLVFLFLCNGGDTRCGYAVATNWSAEVESVWFWSWGPQIKPLEGDLRSFLGYQAPNTRERSKSPEKAIYGSSRSIWYPHSREQKEAHRTPFTAQSSTNKRRLTQAQKASQRTTSMNSDTQYQWRMISH